MTLEETVIFEMSKGFDSRDEFLEVAREIALEYNVSVGKVILMFTKVKHVLH